MISRCCNVKKERKNPNDPSRFIGKLAVTEEGEVAKIQNYLDTDKVEEEARYDGMYAVTTDLLDDEVQDILKVRFYTKIFMKEYRPCLKFGFHNTEAFFYFPTAFTYF